MSGGFAFEDCLLKHYIRKEVWLPRCKERLAYIRKTRKQKSDARPLRYFTFCAVGALDVLLLDREKVIRRSKMGEFDTVFFFDRDEEAVFETRKRIPGANGFPGDFVDVVLEANNNILQGQALDAPEGQQNTRAVRLAQMRKAQLQSFMSAFPFDVINLDVEQYLFRPKEELPGKLTRALRTIFEWQKGTGRDTKGKEFSIDEFTLMFTTQVGPANLSDEYVAYLRDDCLQRNLETYDELRVPYLRKSGGRDVKAFFEEDFANAFKLAVPKSLIELAFECDWHIDGDGGIDVFQFSRTTKTGGYEMLHMAMTVRRQNPPKDKRAPGQRPSDKVTDEHKSAILRLFERDVTEVAGLMTDAQGDLEADLNSLFEHRKKYYMGE